MSSKISNKIKVPGGAFYAGDGLTVDPVTRTVSASGGGGDSGVTTLHIYISAIDKNNPTFTADKTPKEMLYVATPTWCVMTFAAGVLGEKEVSLSVPPAWGAGAPGFGYLYDTNSNKNKYVALGNTETNKWEVDLVFFGS